MMRVPKCACGGELFRRIDGDDDQFECIKCLQLLLKLTEEPHAQ